MLTTLGVLKEPLGNSRLHAARLVASLLQSGSQTSSPTNTGVLQELCRLNALDLLLVRYSPTPDTEYYRRREKRPVHRCIQSKNYSVSHT